MARTEYGTTWWGQKWLEALNNIDFDNRIPRGKSYANTGKVLSFKLDFSKHKISAKVKGHYDPFYRVEIELPPISQTSKEKLLEAIASSPLVVAKLSTRELDPELLTLCRQIGVELFPRSWNDLKMNCTCPDWAVPCKHLAAVIYKISQEIDANPFILFSLRGLDLIGELEKQGISIERALTAELPSWSELLAQAAPPESELFASKSHESNNFQLENYASENDWLEGLGRLSFKDVTFDAEALLNLLQEKPAGFVGSSLKEEISKVLSKASRLAKSQLSSISEHSAPRHHYSADDMSSMLCINSWGYPVASDGLFWNEYDIGTNALVECSPGKIRATGTRVYLHEMFSGYLNAKRLTEEPEAVEALYNVWVIATKLVMQKAAMPQLYEPADGCFSVRWIPAVSEQSVRALTQNAGSFLQKLGRPYFEILRRPDSVSNIVLGEIVLSVFITSYIHAAYDALRSETVYPEQSALFVADYLDCTEDKTAGAAKLRLAEWLSPLNSLQNSLDTVLTVTDPLDNETAREIDDAAQTPLEVELGFVITQKKIGADNTESQSHYVPMQTILDETAYKSVRFDAMRTAARLSRHCPQLTEILKKGESGTHVSMQELTPLLFHSLPALRLLGVRVILPRSLRRLLTPTVSMKVDLDKEWDQSQGFLGLAQLLNFNWVTAVGDRPVSADEFELIKAQAGSVVRFHDSFMFVSPEAIRKIQSNLADGGKKFNQLSLLRAALSGEIDDAPVTLSKSVKEALARLLQESPVTVPKTIHAKLRPYQERGFSWLTRNNKIGLGSILADDMGLGKTLQVICMLEQLRLDSCLKKKPALIVVPTSLIANWQREVQKFSPKFKLALYYGAQRNFPAQDADAVLTTYGTMRNSADMLKKKSFSVLVFDEAQNLKNHTTSTFRVAKSIKHDTTVAMSGTPVENRLAEYWSIMELTNPGLLGTITQFKKDYAAPIEVMHNIKVADQFKRLTAPFIMRRLKTDKSVISDLPEKISTDEYCSLTAEQAALYEETVSKYLKIIEANEGFERRSIVLQLIIRLKQICNSPMQYEANSPYSNPENSGKTLRLFELLDELFESGRKVLIFTQFKSMGSLLQQWLKARYQKEPNFIYGGLSQKKRQEMVDSFQTDRSQNALILSLKAAGTGLNLTAASAIIHYDLWWNPAVEAQATDRAYRIGQKKNVNVYRMICANTFEERINEMIEAKKSLAALTVESGENWIGDLGNDELRELFKLH